MNLAFSIMSSGVFVSAAINYVRHVYSVSSYSTLNPIIFDQNGAKNISLSNDYGSDLICIYFLVSLFFSSKVIMSDL